MTGVAEDDAEPELIELPRQGTEVAVRRTWTGGAAAALLSCADLQELDWLDPYQAWGRPISAEALDAEEVQAASEALAASPGLPCRWGDGELVQRIRLSVVLGDEVAGLGEAVVVRREPPAEQRTCRICLEAEGPEVEMLANCCACRGSARFICRTCLLAAWAYRGDDSRHELGCRICNQPFVGRAAEVLCKQLRAHVTQEEEKRPTPDAQEELRRYVQKIAVATKLWQQDRHKEAAEIFRECIAKLSGMPAGRNYEVTARHNLALVLLYLAEFSEALRHMQSAHQAFVEIFGSDHSLSLKSAHNEALILAEAGRIEEACQHYEVVLRDRRRVLGKDHPDTLKTVVDMGRVLGTVGGDPERGEELLRLALTGLERIVGRDSPLTCKTLHNLSLTMANRCQQTGQPLPLEALEFAREALEGTQRHNGEDHIETLENRKNLGSLLLRVGRFDEGIMLLRQALAGMQKSMGFAHPKTKGVMELLRKTLEAQGDADKARELVEEFNRHQAVSGAQEPTAPKKERGIVAVVLLGVLVAPARRHLGFGRALVEHLQVLAKELRAQYVEVHVPMEASEASAFFEACGFKTCDEACTEVVGRRCLRWVLP